MKKALAGPAKPTAKKLPERRAMIAAARRRTVVPLAWMASLTRKVDRVANRELERAQPPLARLARRLRRLAGRWVTRAGRLLRPAAALLFRGLARGERLLRRGVRAGTRAATRASAVLTPIRAICAVTVAAAACLAVSQFIDYRAVEVGQPGYTGLPAIAAPPTVAARTAGQAHSYLLVPLALLAAILAVVALRPRRRGLARAVVLLGLISLAVTLLIDRPSGLALGAQASRFAGAHAVLDDGFYAELAAAAALVLGGLLYYARPCPIRINLSGRVASALRRRRRRPASSRARDARKGSPRRSGAASAPASRP
jgi:hypothetical protein